MSQQHLTRYYGGTFFTPGPNSRARLRRYSKRAGRRLARRRNRAALTAAVVDCQGSTVSAV